MRRPARPRAWYISPGTSPMSTPWKAWIRVCSSISIHRTRSAHRSPRCARSRPSAAVCAARTSDSNLIQTAEPAAELPLMIESSPTELKSGSRSARLTSMVEARGRAAELSGRVLRKKSCPDSSCTLLPLKSLGVPSSHPSPVLLVNSFFFLSELRHPSGTLP